MKISDMIKSGKPTLSFEVFPPKTSDAYEKVAGAAYKIADLKPDFMSVTCGAAGTTDSYTALIASEIKNKHSVEALQHYTCINATRENVLKKLEFSKKNNIDNILALRGDIPENYDKDADHDFKHASELIYFIKEHSDMCVGAACYPERHPESPDVKSDIAHLKEKAEAGCDFITTQMFFDNNVLYKYLYKIREAGIYVPVIAGIMPVTNAKQIKRIMSLSNAEFPSKFMNIIDRFGPDNDAMLQAGIIYACEQIIDLIANGVDNIHIYTMNKPEVAGKIQESLSGIIPSCQNK
jgi:methylenetetrahydrofolate reductase (NADPH)